MLWAESLMVGSGEGVHCRVITEDIIIAWAPALRQLSPKPFSCSVVSFGAFVENLKLDLQSRLHSVCP